MAFEHSRIETPSRGEAAAPEQQSTSNRGVKCRTQHLKAAVNEPLSEGTGPDSSVQEEALSRLV